MNRQRPEDELDVLLAGGGDHPGLSHALASLRSLGNGPAPAPSAELSALFAPKVVPLRPRRRRGVVLSALVAASMGLGVGTVAAVSTDFRDGLRHAVDGAIVLVQPGPGELPNNDDGTSAGAPVPFPTRDNGGPQPAPVEAGAEDSTDEDEGAKETADKAAAAKAAAAKKAVAKEAAAKRAAEAKQAAAKEVPGRAGAEPGRSGDSAAATRVAPGNGQQVPGLAKDPGAVDKAAGQANGLERRAERAPQRITVNPPVQAKQAPGQPVEKAQAPGQLRDLAEKAADRVTSKPDGAPGQNR